MEGIQKGVYRMGVHTERGLGWGAWVQVGRGQCYWIKQQGCWVGVGGWGQGGYMERGYTAWACTLARMYVYKYYNISAFYNTLPILKALFLMEKWIKLQMK